MGEFMNEQTINKANRNFERMNRDQKDEVVNTITAAALAIEFETGTWKEYMVRKASTTLGCQHRFYSILSRFKRWQIEQFINAYSEPLDHG